MLVSKDAFRTQIALSLVQSIMKSYSLTIRTGEFVFPGMYIVHASDSILINNLYMDWLHIQWSRENALSYEASPLQWYSITHGRVGAS
jgi:hypothetical protein